MSIIAVDQDSSSSKKGDCQLLIYIEDINDNAPEIDLRVIVGGSHGTKGKKVCLIRPLKTVKPILLSIY